MKPQYKIVLIGPESKDRDYIEHKLRDLEEFYSDKRAPSRIDLTIEVKEVENWILPSVIGAALS